MVAFIIVIVINIIIIFVMEKGGGYYSTGVQTGLSGVYGAIQKDSRQLPCRRFYYLLSMEFCYRVIGLGTKTQ